METKLTELKKDCKSIKQKGQSLKSKDLGDKSESLSILKWIKFATNYHQKQSEWEAEKTKFISKRMQFLRQNATKQLRPILRQRLRVLDVRLTRANCENSNH